MKVRYSYLKQQFANSGDLWAKLKRFVSTGDFTLGKELEKFEKNFAKLIGAKYAVGVNSGTDAIKLSLKVLGVKQNDEVITAANTFVATVGDEPNHTETNNTQANKSLPPHKKLSLLLLS